MNTRIDSTRNEPTVLPAEKPARSRINCITIGGIVILFGVAFVVALYFAVGKNMLASIYEKAGNTYNGQGDFDRAISNFDQAIKFNPNAASAYSGRGIAYAEKGNLDQAIADFDRAIQLQPDFAGAYYNRGLTYDRKHNPAHAILDYTKAIELQPDFENAYYNRGIAYAATGDPGRAIADFDRLISLNPDFYQAYVQRGLANEFMGDFEHAIADFNQAISLNPDYAAPYYGRGLAYFFQRKYDQAIADFSTAIDLAPAFVDAYFQRGHAYIRTEQYELAVADYDMVIEQSPQNAGAYNNRCWSYFKMGEYELALPDCEKAIELVPDDANTLDSRARVYQALGRVEDAIMDFERIIELGTSPDLVRQAQDELEELKVLQPVSDEIAAAEPGTNLALRKPVRVSREIPDFPGEKAIDGKTDNWWSAGAFAPQWIQIDLEQNYVVAEIKLIPSQSPTGETIHNVFAKGPATNHEFVLIHTFDGVTVDSQLLVYRLDEPLQGIRYIRIETTSSPSWIGWREIMVIAGIHVAQTNQVMGPTSLPSTPSFTLQAVDGWVDSGFDVVVGKAFTITAQGEAATGDLDKFPGAVSGPDGQDALGCGQYEGAPPPCAMDDAPYGALVGRIGEDGEPFLIGLNSTLVPTTSGDLYVAVNDNLVYYDDNSGSYLIFIH